MADVFSETTTIASIREVDGMLAASRDRGDETGAVRFKVPHRGAG